MPPRRPDPRGADSVAAVLRALDAGADPEPDDRRSAARYLLYTLAARHPGRVLEVRIPPVAAVQWLPRPGATRGQTPAGGRRAVPARPGAHQGDAAECRRDRPADVDPAGGRPARLGGRRPL